MDLGLAGIVFTWLGHFDPACIVCNWDPATGSYIPAAGAVAGTSLGLNDLFGPFYDLPTVQVPGGGVDPLDPGSYPGALPPGGSYPTPDPATTPSGEDSPISDMLEPRADREAYNRDRESVRPFPSDFRPNVTNDTPPPPQTIWEQGDAYIYDTAADFFHTVTGH